MTALLDRVTLRNLELGDRDMVASFYGPDRVTDQFNASGMYIEAEVFDIDRMVPVAESYPDELKLWVSVRDDGAPMALHLCQKLGFPGVWGYSIVTAEAVAEGRGFGTALMTGALDALFEDESVHRVMGYISVDVPSSLRMVEKVGFTIEGVAREHIRMKDGSWADAKLVSLLSHEWLAIRQPMGTAG